MRCEICGEYLEFIKKYGDGKIEPIEEVYVCPNCDCRYIWRQDTGWEYYDSDIDWDKV